MKVKKWVLVLGAGLALLVVIAFALQDSFIDRNIQDKKPFLHIEKEDNSLATNASEVKSQNLKYVSEKTYEKIAELCSDIDFKGTFKSVDLERDSYYRAQYLKVLKGDASYIDRLEEKGKSDLIEFEPQNMRNYVNYYFDMNEDGIGELILFGDRMKYMYIFSYNPQNKKVELLDIEKAGSSFLLGSNKMGACHDGVGLTYEFYEIDKNGNKKSKIFFYSEGYLNDDTKKEEELYMLGFGEDSELLDNFILLAKEMNEQLYEENSTYFLRLSKEQYEKETHNYFESRKQSEENIEKVMYTFDELFGQNFDVSPSIK